MELKVITDIRVIKNGFSGHIDRIEIKTIEVKEDPANGNLRTIGWDAKESDWTSID